MTAFRTPAIFCAGPTPSQVLAPKQLLSQRSYPPLPGNNDVSDAAAMPANDDQACNGGATDSNREEDQAAAEASEAATAAAPKRKARRPNASERRRAAGRRSLSGMLSRLTLRLGLAVHEFLHTARSTCSTRD